MNKDKMELLLKNDIALNEEEKEIYLNQDYEGCKKIVENMTTYKEKSFIKAFASMKSWRQSWIDFPQDMNR